QYCLAVCYLQLPRPRPDLAKAHLTNCLSRRRDFPWIYLLRGFARCELGKYEAAAADYQQVDGNPDRDVRYVLLVNRGVLRLRQEEAATGAAHALGAAAALAPDFCPAHAGLVQLCRQRWLGEAVADLERARALQPRE